MGGSDEKLVEKIHNENPFADKVFDRFSLIRATEFFFFFLISKIIWG